MEIYPFVYPSLQQFYITLFFVIPAMKTYRYILAAAAAFFLCNSSFSQEKWSLEKCITHARENNLQIKQQEIMVEQAGNELLASKMKYVPSVNASMNHNLSWGRSVNLNDLEIIENQMSQSTSLNLSASIPIFEGMRKQNTVKSQIKQLEIAGVNVEKLKNEISLAVARGYLQVLLGYEMEKSAVESCNSLQEQVDRCRNMVEAGSLAYSSLLELEAQLANERVQVVTAKNNLRSNILSLAQLLDIEDYSNFSIEVPETGQLVLSLPEEDVAQIYDMAVSMPEIRGAELAVEQSRLQYRIQKGAALPTLSFSAGYGTYYSNNQETPFFSQFDNNRNPSMGFGLSIPIFNNLRNSTSIKNARLNVKSKETELGITRQNLLKEIQQAYNDALAGFEKFTAAKQNLASARESFNYSQEKFNAGMLSGTDYTIAKTNLSKAESECIQSKFQYIFQLKVLDYYKNVPLTL